MDTRSVTRRASQNLGSPEARRSRSAEPPLHDHLDDGVRLDFEPTDSFDESEIDGESAHHHCVPTINGHAEPNRERLSSESSISKKHLHRRAMSDPFDTPESGGITDGDLHHVDPVKDYGLLEEEENALPTLARFPFAETANRNCWSEPPVGIFSVRGAGYLENQKKVGARRYLLSARGCDLFLADNPNQCTISK